MKLLDTFTDYVSEDDKGQRAVFEAAMIQRLQNEGYKMVDLLYELFLCQVAISKLSGQIEALKTPKKGK